MLQPLTTMLADCGQRGAGASMRTRLLHPSSAWGRSALEQLHLHTCHGIPRQTLHQRCPCADLGASDCVEEPCPCLCHTKAVYHHILALPLFTVLPV